MVVNPGELVQYHKSNYRFLEAQRRLADLQIQAATGEKAQTYDGIARDANRLLSVENALQQTNQYVASIQRVELRTDTMDAVLTDIEEVVASFQALMVSATNAENFEEFEVENTAKEMLEQLSSLLNTKVDGRYIFSGSATGTKPVTLPDPLPVATDADGDLTDGIFTPYDPSILNPGDPGYDEIFGYFEGNTDILSVRIDDDQVIEYGIHAQELPFAEIMYAMRIAATFEGGPDDMRKSRLDSALEISKAGFDKVVDRHSELGQRLQIMEQIKSTHEDSRVRLGDIIGTLEGANIPETMTRLSREQTVLEASMLTLTRFSSSLIDFLR